MHKKIVVVEDNLLIQELHKHYLTNLGHEVVGCFERGQDVINFFKENNEADLILMDIRLEDDIDGIQAMEEIQKSFSVPVVYVSANSDDSNYARAVSTNMKAFLSKPLSSQDLETALKSLSSLTDSILYAEKIQKSLFPQVDEINSYFNKNLYINRPKDIITGDFCFFHKQDEANEIIGGVADCTGHGIPGALLSILASHIISTICNEKDNLLQIIEDLNFQLKRSLSRGKNTFQLSDSLDLVIFKIKPEQSEIEISGLKRIFIYYSYENKKHTVVYLNENHSKNNIDTIENTSEIASPLIKIKYHENDIFYFFSDGITDQFGGSNDKKLMRKRLLDFFDSDINNQDLKSKQLNLNLFLRRWQGRNEQTDDMILLGINPSSFNRNKVKKNS
jgi:sigma-B regulation protein RsbU (phosphoserine phosphatase)